VAGLRGNQAVLLQHRKQTAGGGRRYVDFACSSRGADPPHPVDQGEQTQRRIDGLDRVPRYSVSRFLIVEGDCSFRGCITTACTIVVALCRSLCLPCRTRSATRGPALRLMPSPLSPSRRYPGAFRPAKKPSSRRRWQRTPAKPDAPDCRDPTESMCHRPLYSMIGRRRHGSCLYLTTSATVDPVNITEGIGGFLWSLNACCRSRA